MVVKIKISKDFHKRWWERRVEEVGRLVRWEVGEDG
jgi:hypothetical protein